MALRCDAAADLLSRTTTLPGLTAFTIMGWFMLAVDRNTWTAFITYGDSTGANVYNLGTGVNGTSIDVWNGSAHGAGSALSVGTWYHLALTASGSGASALKAYVNGVLDVTANGDATVTNEILVLGNSTSADFLNGRLAAGKIYGATLTVDEIANEMQYYVPLRHANLNTWLPCVEPTVNNNAIDLSGIGGDMTIGGTLTVEDGPPIAWAPMDQMMLQWGHVATVAPGLHSWAHGGQDARFATLLAQ